LLTRARSRGRKHAPRTEECATQLHERQRLEPTPAGCNSPVVRLLAVLVSSLYLPFAGMWSSVQPDGVHLLVSGYARVGNGCAWLTVDPATLAAKETRTSCARPPSSVASYVPVVIPNPHSQWQTVRLAHIIGATVRYSPVVLRYSDASDTRPIWTYGGGSLWLYDVATTRGSELLRFSATSGHLLQQLAMPKLFRPVVAANLDGLWLVAAVNGGVSRQYPAALYHVAPGSSQAVIEHREGRAALWITAHQHTVWADLISGRQTVALWRFDGSNATARRLSRHTHVTATAAVYGNGSLWAIANHGVVCTKERVLRIDAATGRETTIATVPVLDTCGNLVLEPAGLTYFHGAVFFLDGPRLYRVRP
jgi:hypothetical protein